MERLALLTYDYVDDVLERRAPHREAHLAAIAEASAAGDLRIAGAAGDPPSTGLLAFTSDAAAEAFLARDPYVAAGLVVSHSIRPWNVVTP